ncbi:MAG TPA: hypothetical protein VKN18_25980 [Blastocatellia bacterium]|nr:hypothetical protein [Blastocatellia bacterium]
MKSEKENDPYFKLLFEEAALLLNRAEEAGPDNAEPDYVARAFHRLVEGAYRHLYSDNQPDFDVGAVAQTAATRFAIAHQDWWLVQTAHLLSRCLQQPIKVS